MDALTRYIIDNYAGLMTHHEHLAWVYFYKKLGKDHLFPTEVCNLIENGEVYFYNQLKKRLLEDHSTQIILNFCPKCGEIAKTPRSKQCLKCKHSWRETGNMYK